MGSLGISFGKIDPAAKSGISAASANAAKPWSVISDLRYDNMPEPIKAATCEWNHAVLDGSFEEFPDSPNSPTRTWGFWSSELSGADGLFAVPPTLDITFSDYHKSAGLTFHFYPHTDDWCSKARVTWYGSQGTGDQLMSAEYDMEGVVGEVKESVSNWRHIKIEFLRTNIPYRYIKLFALDFGVTRRIKDSEISAARVMEEVDPTGESLSMNTLDCNIRTRESIFSPVTSPDFDDTMMKRQVLTVTRDGQPFGTFFLEDWVDPYQSGIVFDLSAGDAVSVLDMYEHMGGLYSGKSVVSLLDELFGLSFPTGLVKYVLDPSYLNATVSGWLPIGSCALSLQHICFALDAVVDASRDGDVWISPRDPTPTFTVPLDRQYRKGSDRPTPYYSVVDVFSYSYTPTQEPTTAHNGEMPAGQHTVRFREPLHGLTATGAAIAVSHVNYAVVNVPSAGAVVLEGKRYADNAFPHSVRNSFVDAGEVETVKRYEGYTLVSPEIAPALAQSRFAWLQNRVLTETDVVLGDLEVGRMATVKTRGRDVAGLITALDCNLRANKARMEVVGNAVG